jgi:hypothetical protein
MSPDAMLRMTDDGDTFECSWASFAEANADTPDVVAEVAVLQVGESMMLAGGGLVQIERVR